MRHLKNLQGFANSTRDVMPDAVTWSGVNQDDFNGTFGYTSRRITGINESIVLGVSFDSTYGDLYYAKNPGFGNGTDYSRSRPPSQSGFTQLLNGATFSASNLDYVDFGTEFAVANIDPWVTVINRSDANKILDTFRCDYFG